MRGYSRIVGWGKVALPIAAVLVIGLVFFFSREPRGALDLATASNAATLGAGLELNRPRFTGVTPAGEPFEITAASATPDRPVPTRIDLESPEGTIRLGSGVVVTVRAAAGALLRTDDRIVLDGDIDVQTSDGYAVKTGRIVADVSAGTLTAPGMISASGPDGSISAQRMHVVRANADDDTVTVRFSGNVSVRFLPASSPSRPD